MGESARRRIDKHFMFFLACQLSFSVFTNWEICIFPGARWAQIRSSSPRWKSALSSNTYLQNRRSFRCFDSLWTRPQFTALTPFLQICDRRPSFKYASFSFLQSIVFLWYWSAMTRKVPDKFSDAGMARWIMTPFVRNLNVFEHNT